jgi:hypothetical protein
MASLEATSLGIFYFNIITLLLVEVLSHIIHVLLLLGILIEAIWHLLLHLLGLIELIKDTQSAKLSLLGYNVLLLVLEGLLLLLILLLLLVKLLLLTPPSPIFNLLIKPLTIKFFEFVQDTMADL